MVYFYHLFMHIISLKMLYFVTTELLWISLVFINLLKIWYCFLRQLAMFALPTMHEGHMYTRRCQNKRSEKALCTRSSLSYCWEEALQVRLFYMYQPGYHIANFKFDVSFLNHFMHNHNLSTSIIRFKDLHSSTYSTRPHIEGLKRTHYKRILIYVSKFPAILLCRWIGFE